MRPAAGTARIWGGRPFLEGGRREPSQRRPGMMILIAMAITVAYVAIESAGLILAIPIAAGAVIWAGITLPPALAAILVSVS